MPCKCKRRYRDKRAATRELHRLQNKSTREVKPVRAYRCPYCKGWHLTSKPYYGKESSNEQE